VQRLHLRLAKRSASRVTQPPRFTSGTGGNKTSPAGHVCCRNRRAANAARFALAAIHLQLLGKIARLAVALQEILQRRAALLNRAQQDQL
jgi:hypothetical protein